MSFRGQTLGGLVSQTTGTLVDLVSQTTGTLVDLVSQTTGALVGFVSQTTGTLVGFVSQTTGTLVGFVSFRFANYSKTAYVCKESRRNKYKIIKQRRYRSIRVHFFFL